MVALTCNFHVLTSRITTGISAILFPIWHITEAWYMRALCRFLIHRSNSILSKIHRECMAKSRPAATHDVALSR